MQVASENHVLRLFVSKTGFCQIVGLSAKKCVFRQICEKNAFLFLELSFMPVCGKNWLFPNIKPVVPKNAFFVKSAKRTQLASENYVLLQFALLQFASFAKIQA